MRKLIVVLIAGALAASLTSSAMAAVNWQYVGKSGFVQTNLSSLFDRQRIAMSSAVTDNAGNVYVVCNNAENGTYAYNNPAATGAYPSYTVNQPVFTAKQGGITVFSPTGTKLYDINVSEIVDSAWSSYWWGPTFAPPSSKRTDSKMVGAITKLVKGGDGKVYGLMNWQEIAWDYSRQNQRIVRINSNGTVDAIWSPKMDYTFVSEDDITYTGVGSGVYDIRSNSWVEDSGTQLYNRIRGLTVGGDGNVYWTMNGASNYWKYRTLWRYNVSTGEVSEAPSNFIDAAANPQTRQNNGWSESHRMFNLEYVGNDYFALISGGGTRWAATSMKWDKGTQVADSHGWGNTDYPGYRHGGAPVPIGSSNDPSSLNSWGRDYVTATAYDQTRKKLWVAGRGDGSGPYTYDNSSGSATIIDLGNNPALRMTKAAGTKNSYNRSVLDADKLLSFAARFRVEASSADWNAAFMCVMPKEGGSGQSPAGILKVKNGHFVLVDVYDVQTADLGPKNSNWNEIYFVADSNVGTLECWFNGSPVSITAPTAGWKAMSPQVKFGTGITHSYAFATLAGTATVVYDWVGFATQRVTPSDFWPSTPICSVWNDPVLYPNQFLTSNVMTRFNGAESNAGLFNQLVWTGESLINQTTTWATDGIQSSEAWHTNGNAPDSTGISNRGQYWVNSLAVNPDDGFCWMGWSAEANYSYPDRGNVLIHGVNNWELYDAGRPEDGADIVALTFHKADADHTTAYALTCNRTSGEYHLYKAAATTQAPFDATNYVPLDMVKGHRRGVMLALDGPVVTYTDTGARFFYVESVDANGTPLAGIRVVPGNDGIGIPYSVGLKVNLRGYLDVVNGEAVIRAFGVDTPESGTVPPALTMQCKAVGGTASGAQPPLTGSGANNTGLLVSIAGTVTAVDPTNEFDPQWFTVDDGTGGFSYYPDPMTGQLISVPGVMVKLRTMVSVGSFVTVVGVSSVDTIYWQPPTDPNAPLVLKGTQRCVLPRDIGDMLTY